MPAVAWAPSSSHEPTIATADAGRKYRDGGHLRPRCVSVHDGVKPRNAMQYYQNLSNTVRIIRSVSF